MGETLRRGVQRTSPVQRGCSCLTNFIIPGLPNDVSLMILVRLPRALHGSFCCVCCAWRDALQPLAMSALRNTLHISEMWTLFFFQDRSIAFYDPLLQCLSSPIRYPCDDSCDVHVVGAIGNLVFILQSQIMGLQCQFPNTDIRCFDITSMQWQSDSIPLWSDALRIGFASAVVDGHLCVAGGGEDGRQVGRFDVKSRRWEMMPKMHKARIGAAAVVLQGRLHVIGGGKRYGNNDVRSGEIWDPRSGKWVLEPELWPRQLNYLPPKVVVVMDTLYALRDATMYSDNSDMELFHYVSEFQLWISLGHLPLEEYVCACGGMGIAPRLVGVGKELWVVLNCSLVKKTCIATILSCVPSTGPSPLSWRREPITSSIKFPPGCVAALNNVQV